MIIKSHIRGGYRAAANYLKDPGANESIRLVDLGDPGAKDLDDAFRHMRAVGSLTRAKKPLHHVSINPMKDERLTDAQVLCICTRLEEKYGYMAGEHQCVIVEHVKDGRQHFHVMWNRVSLATGRPVWPGHHWNKSKQAAREMEAELGLKRPMPRRSKPRSRRASRMKTRSQQGRKRHGKNRARAITDGYLEICKHPLRDLRLWVDTARVRGGRPRGHRPLVLARPPAGLAINDLLRPLRIARARRWLAPVRPARQPLRPPRPEMSIEELIAWAWEHGRSDILAQFGIYVTFDL